MTRREYVTEWVGSICFVALLYMMLMALYVMAPAQPSMHSEAVYREASNAAR